MFRKFLAAPLFALAVCASAQEVPQPATVVVAFDRENIRPLIVEGIADRASGRMVEANDPVRIASISKLIIASMFSLRSLHSLAYTKLPISEV